MPLFIRLSPLLLIAIACSSKPTNYTKVQSVHVEDVGVTMTLPSIFKEYSIMEQVDYWNYQNVDPEIKKKKIEYLLHLDQQNQKSHFLADTTVWVNNVRITENKFPIKIGKYTQQKGFLLMDSFIQEDAAFLGIRMEAIENRYFSLTNGNDILKIRYRVTESNFNTASFLNDADEYNYYITFYMVNGARNVVVIASHEVEDFEYFVRTIVFD